MRVGAKEDRVDGRADRLVQEELGRRVADVQAAFARLLVGRLVVVVVARGGGPGGRGRGGRGREGRLEEFLPCWWGGGACYSVPTWQSKEGKKGGGGVTSN